MIWEEYSNGILRNSLLLLMLRTHTYEGMMLEKVEED